MYACTYSKNNTPLYIYMYIYTLCAHMNLISPIYIYMSMYVYVVWLTPSINLSLSHVAMMFCGICV